MKFDFSNRFPEIHPDTFIAKGAQVIGKVILKQGVSIWYNTVLRGDINDIVIDEDSNIQDNCVIHVADAFKATIGKGVTVGHSVTIHACSIGDHCLIGIGSIILDGAVIGNNSVVAAGSLVSPNKVFPDGSLILGSPARVKRKLTEEERKYNHEIALKYKEIWQAYVDIPMVFLF